MTFIKAAYFSGQNIKVEENSEMLECISTATLINFKAQDKSFPLIPLPPLPILSRSDHTAGG